MGVAIQMALTTLFASAVTCKTEANFEIDSSLAEKVCPAERRTFEDTVVSVRACAFASEETGSAGFVYIGGTSMCYGCDTLSMFKTGDFTELPGAVFHRRYPAPEGFFYVAGTIMRIAENTGLTYDQAEAACSVFGQLVKIDSLEKKTAINDTLTDPENGLSGTDYWIQCRRADDGVWRFDDGARMTPTYWAENEPNGLPSPGNCCGIRKRFSFRWDDDNCDETVYFLRDYICESSGFL